MMPDDGRLVQPKHVVLWIAIKKLKRNWLRAKTEVEGRRNIGELGLIRERYMIVQVMQLSFQYSRGC
jgi:hypothetical protein